IAAVGLKPPDEAGRAIRERIDLTELGHEFGQPGAVGGSEDAPDVELRNVPFIHGDVVPCFSAVEPATAGIITAVIGASPSGNSGPSIRAHRPSSWRFPSLCPVELAIARTGS